MKNFFSNLPAFNLSVFVLMFGLAFVSPFASVLVLALFLANAQLNRLLTPKPLENPTKEIEDKILYLTSEISKLKISNGFLRE